MSTCISRHGEYGSHTYGEGAERFVCQRCAVLDEDAMLAALATAEAEVERLRAENDKQKRLLLDETYRPEGGEIVMRELAKVKAERDEWRMKAEVNTEAADRLGRMLEEAEAERDALSARLQAVRALHERLAGAWETDFCRHDNQRWPCTTIRLSDASLGTPGDEKPQDRAAKIAELRADVGALRDRLDAPPPSPIVEPDCTICHLPERLDHHSDRTTKGYHPFSPVESSGSAE